jgi:Flp pilus assembly protein CpaB
MRSATTPLLIILGMLLASFTIMGSCLGPVWLFTRSKDQPQQTSPSRPETAEVLVAAQEIPEGALILQPERLFVQKSFTKGEEPPDAISDVEQLRNQVLVHKLAVGQYCGRKDLSGSGAFIVDLPPDLRAMGIRVIGDDPGRFVVPGSRADILVRERLGEDKFQYKILLQNILLLAVNRADMPPIEAKGGERNPRGEIPPDEAKGGEAVLIVSVAVTAEQGEKLADALKEGPLRLIVRPFDAKSRK